MSKEHEEYYDRVCYPHLKRIDDQVAQHKSTIDKLGAIETILLAHTSTLKDHTDKIDEMSRKVFNGYGSTINSVEAKLDAEMVRTANGFKEVKGTLRTLTKVAVSSVILLLVGLVGVIGSVWVSDRVTTRDLIELYRPHQGYTESPGRTEVVDDDDVQ